MEERILKLIESRYGKNHKYTFCKHKINVNENVFTLKEDCNIGFFSNPFISSDNINLSCVNRKNGEATFIIS